MLDFVSITGEKLMTISLPLIVFAWIFSEALGLCLMRLDNMVNNIPPNETSGWKHIGHSDLPRFFAVAMGLGGGAFTLVFGIIALVDAMSALSKRFRYLSG